jgi:5-methylthioadenosine/S-adenosylhomocysteine deaminase
VSDRQKKSASSPPRLSSSAFARLLAADYLLPISAAPIANGAIVVDGKKIVAVGTKSDLAKEFPQIKVEDFGEAAIMPGLVNCHSHLEITAMRGFLDDVEADFYSWLIKLTKTRGERLSEADVKTAALAGALEGARAGVTCFGDIGRFGIAGFEALKTNGLRGVVFQETEFSPNDKTADEDFEKLVGKFTELKAAETALVRAGLSPHAPYTVSRRLFELITDYAIKENIKITVHAAESVQETDLMESGAGFFAGIYKNLNLEWNAPRCSSVEYLSQIGVLRAKPLLAHCVKVSGADIELLAESDSRIVHCPKSNAKFGHGTAPLEKFLNRKIRVGFGSDSVASNNNCDILEEARFATLVARSAEGRNRFLTATEIIETATLGGALALGLDAEIGTLEAGKQADVIVISLADIAQQPVHDVYSALLFASNARDVRMTLVAGEEIYRDGRALKINEAEVKAKLREISAKMRE